MPHPSLEPRPLVVALLVFVMAGCAPAPAGTPPISPGSAAAPREVNLILKDYAFVPDVVDLVPGETVLLHVINGGLDVHEAVIGDEQVQTAWSAAHKAVEGAPPGPTPMVSVPPDLAGLRVVAASGQRVDVVWTVPDDAAQVRGGYLVGCHIPGHFERGMVASVRFVDPGGTSLQTPTLP
jgi:uncharacterized cupredoxin-like copper-binding protein